MHLFDMTKIYLDYDQAQLDAQYDQATLVPDLSDYHARWTHRTKVAKERYPCYEHVAYGTQADEWMDVYRPHGLELAPILIFFHGGAWLSQQIGLTGNAAETYVSAGAVYIAVNFSVAPTASLDLMVGQCREATAFIARNAHAWNADARRIYLVGHSSGAHLASNVAVTDWAAYGLAGDTIKGLAVTSGPYDLEPVKLSKRNTYLHLDQGGVDRNSAGKHLHAALPPAVAAWGGKELIEFQRQSAAFASAWESATGSVERLIFPENNHFDQCDEIAKPDGKLTRAILGMMGLESA